jgi:hypothetical protein
MPQTQINCPRCNQPIPANVEQLFDANADPGAKQRLLGGVANYAHCPYCGFEGRLATPIVYHDADKELLLTFFPSELNVPVNEQEKMIGPMITKVTDHLPPEKRKAYLFKPQTFLTYESLIERILGADGITPEMIKAQQDRLNLIQRLLQASGTDVRAEIIKQEGELLDEEFFVLFSRLLQSAAASGQEQIAKEMSELQKQLFAESEYGRKIQASVGEIEAAAKSLQEAGKELTREKLLEITIQAPNEERLRALVSLARPGMDYVFFQTLSERIDKAQGDEKKKLEALREKLLDFTNELDQQIEARYKETQEFIESLLSQEDVAKAARANLDKFTQDSVDIVNALLRQASEKNDYTRMGKLQKIAEVLKEASTPPPEVALIEQLLETPDDQAAEKLLQENESLINENFLAAVTGLIAQMEAQGQAKPSAEDQAVMDRLRNVYRLALKHSMQKNLK